CFALINSCCLACFDLHNYDLQQPPIGLGEPLQQSTRPIRYTTPNHRRTLFGVLPRKYRFPTETSSQGKNHDASFDPRAEPTTTRAAWDTVRDDLRRGMHLHTLNCGLRLTAVAEASTQQAFVDIVDNDVIKPLRTLKVSQKHLVRKGVPVLTIRSWKETRDETRKRIEEDLKGTAAKYADYAENTISKLQRAYLKEYHPQQCAHSTDASQCPQDVPNKRFGGKVSALFRSRREDLILSPS
ncbi:hypothetical protein EDB85DRAFT_2015103, partial [Lactarius pseudohatsudake]